MIYLTPAEVAEMAEMLKVSLKTVSRWALEDPSMPVTRFGRTVRFELAALERWLRAHGRHKAGSSTTQVAANAAEGTR